MVWNREVDIIFYMWLSSCPGPFVEKTIPIKLLWHPYWKSINHKYKALILDSQLNFINLYVYTYANIIPFCLCKLCGRFWNKEVWFLFVFFFQEGYLGSLDSFSLKFLISLSISEKSHPKFGYGLHFICR